MDAGLIELAGRRCFIRKKLGGRVVNVMDEVSFVANTSDIGVEALRTKYARFFDVLTGWLCRPIIARSN